MSPNLAQPYSPQGRSNVHTEAVLESETAAWLDQGRRVKGSNTEARTTSSGKGGGNTLELKEDIRVPPPFVSAPTRSTENPAGTEKRDFKLIKT